MSWAFLEPVLYGSLVAGGFLLITLAYWLAGKRPCPECGHQMGTHVRFDKRLWCRDCSITTGDGYGKHD